MDKTAKDFLEEANKNIESIDSKDAKNTNAIFIDVRRKEDYDAGHIEGAIHAERGMLEFYADPTHTLHNPKLQQDKEYIIYCNAGGQGALSTKTLKDMGYKNVKNLKGGLKEWNA